VLSSGMAALALAQLRLGDHARALALVELHAEQNPEGPALPSTINEYSAVIDAGLGLWEALRAGAYDAPPAETARVEAAAHRLHGFTCTLAKRYRVNQAPAALYLGRFDWLRGAPDRARARWERCLALAEANDQPYDLARAHLHLGHRFPEAGGAAHLAAARTLFEAMGTPYELAATERALAALAGPTAASTG